MGTIYDRVLQTVTDMFLLAYITNMWPQYCTGSIQCQLLAISYSSENADSCSDKTD